MARATRQKQTSKQDLDVEGRKVTVSNLDKVLYPESGFTKVMHSVGGSIRGKHGD